SIDPRAAGDATTSNGGNGENGFVEAAGFRGGFAADSMWLCGWTATDQFGFLATPTEFCAVAEPCPADLNGDGVVSGADVGLLLSAWGTDGADLNGDGVTNGADFGLLLSAFGPCA
ncbi:MAG: Dockerin type domain, partial [Planctomycetota bacterium]